MLVRRAVLAGVTCLLLGGCLAPTDPANTPVGQVRVTLGDRGLVLDTIAVRHTARVNAVAIAREGYELPVSNFRYESSNAAVAVVDSSGMVHGIAPGSANIFATSPDGTRGSATVVVVPSTIDYEISVGGTPGAISFSPDYTKAYVAVTGGSVAFLDAIGFYRVSTLSLGDEIGGLAATSSLLYATHPAAGAVSVVVTATRELQARIPLGGSPTAVVARGSRAWVTARTSHSIVVLDGSSVTTSFAVLGDPAEIALSADGSLLYVALMNGGSWSLAAIDAATGVELGRVALAGEVVSLAVGSTASGAERVYAAIRSANRLVELSIAGGQPVVERSLTIVANSGGVAVRGGARPLLVVSGSPLGIYDATTFAPLDAIAGGGTGRAAVRPDGLFVFVGARDAAAVRVIGL